MFLTDEEEQRLLMAFAYSRKATDFHEKEVLQLAQWANQARQDGALLEAILAGDVLPDIREGRIVFALTAQGSAKAERVLQAALGKGANG